MISQRIEFENLLNTRDLGGMTGADGRKIRSGKLYRSGHLFAATPKDLETLSGMIDTSVDFRSNQELIEKPEHPMPGVRYLHIPILDERNAGVERDENSFAEVRRRMIHDSNIAKGYMTRTYEGFISNDHSVSQYERFIRMLMEDHPKGVLWHCTAGKDRAGFATIIVQELLGVSREDIREDYLFTNICLEPEITDLTREVLKIPGVDPDVASRSVSYIFAAHEDYLDTVYQELDKKYGGFPNYLREALHITKDEQERFRDMYLEE